MIKVLYILPSTNIYGGTPRKTLELIKSLDVDSILYTYDNNFLEFIPLFEKSGAIVINAPFKRNFLKHFFLLRKVIKNNKVQIVQTQFSFGEILAFLCKFIDKKIKIINAFVGTTKPNLFKRTILNFLYIFVDQFIYISKYVKKEKVKQFPILKMKASKVVYNGATKRDGVNKKILPRTKFNLLSIGGLIDVKNFDVLVEMMNILKNKNIFHLTIIGEGPNEKKIKSNIEKYKLGNCISLVGYSDNIGDYLNSCDIYLHPAYAEGFGIAIIEAMLANKPVIVSNKGASIEIITNNIDGKIVRFNDANEWAQSVVELYKDKNLRNKLSTNGLNNANSNFTLDIFSSNYLNIYKNIL